MNRTLSVFVMSVVAAFGISAAAPAQNVSVYYGTLVHSNDVLGNHLDGVGASASAPTKVKRLATRVGFEYFGSNYTISGTPCEGLVLPGTCPTELVRRRGTLTLLSAGTDVQLLKTSRLSLDWLVHLHAASAYFKQRGLSSNMQGHQSRTVFGASSGASARWRPLKRLPITFEAKAETGKLTPANPDIALDGRNWFEESFRISRYTIGLGWTPRF